MELMFRRAFLFAFLPAAPIASAEPMVILLVGPPGAGKTTQAKNLSRKYRIPSIAMSDLLKQEAGWLKTELKKAMRAQMESGDLLNDDEANALITRRIARADAARGFILDGYPISARQAEFLEASLKERGLPPPLVIHLAVPDQVALERMRERGRADDKPGTMEKRLARYHAESRAVLERYAGRRLRQVDGAGSPRQVWADIERALGSL